MRALVYAHFDKHGVVDEYVLFALRCYRSYFDVIYFVSTADLTANSIALVRSLSDVVIVRENTGYDFLSWRIGFEHLPVSLCNEIIFANDSCYGPCRDVSYLLEIASKSQADLWGACINHQFGPHVQSFFMRFGKSLLTSSFARSFWSSIESGLSKWDIIMRYEVGLSATAIDAGFTLGSHINIANPSSDMQNRVIADNAPSHYDPRWLAQAQSILSDQIPNPTQLYCVESLRQGCPFVKVEIFRDNPAGVNGDTVLKMLRAQEWYDAGLIERHLARVCPRSWAANFRSGNARSIEY